VGATHFQVKTLRHVGTEMALHVLAYNMKRVMSILGLGELMETIRAYDRRHEPGDGACNLNIRVFTQFESISDLGPRLDKVR
jgi:hypothetical protein